LFPHASAAIARYDVRVAAPAREHRLVVKLDPYGHEPVQRDDAPTAAAIAEHSYQERTAPVAVGIVLKLPVEHGRVEVQVTGGTSDAEQAHDLARIGGLETPK